MEASVVPMQEAVKSHPVWIAELEAIRAASSQHEAEKRRLERMDSLIQQVPLRFRNKSFADYATDYPNQCRIKHIASRYVDGFEDRLADGSCLIFKGKPGTGKTFLSLIIYQALARKDIPVRYESSLAFVSDLIDVKWQSEAAYKQQVKTFEEIPFLILDEVTESINKGGLPSEMEKQVLFQIINKRYANHRCTLVITNRDTNELYTRLGVPILDRLSEQGITLAFDWDSYRQK